MIRFPLGAGLLCMALSQLSAAAEPAQVQSHPLALDNAPRAASSRMQVAVAPVTTEMRATLRADGTLAMHCKELHRHSAGPRLVPAEKER